MTHGLTRMCAPARPALIIAASSLPPITDASARSSSEFRYLDCRLCDAMQPDDPPASRLPVDFFDV